MVSSAGWAMRGCGDESGPRPGGFRRNHGRTGITARGRRRPDVRTRRPRPHLAPFAFFVFYTIIHEGYSNPEPPILPPPLPLTHAAMSPPARYNRRGEQIERSRRWAAQYWLGPGAGAPAEEARGAAVKNTGWLPDSRISVPEVIFIVVAIVADPADHQVIPSRAPGGVRRSRPFHLDGPHAVSVS